MSGTTYRVRLEFRDKVVGGALIPERYRESEVTNCLQRTTEGHLCLEARQIKSSLVEAQHILYAPKRADKAIFIRPEFIVLEPARVEPDSIESIVGNINGRTILSYAEAIQGAAVEFDLIDSTTQPIDWPKVWTLAEVNGLGACRSMGFGQFDIVKWEAIA